VLGYFYYRSLQKKKAAAAQQVDETEYEYVPSNDRIVYPDISENGFLGEWEGKDEVIFRELIACAETLDKADTMSDKAQEAYAKKIKDEFNEHIDVALRTYYDNCFLENWSERDVYRFMYHLVMEKYTSAELKQIAKKLSQGGK
jgi:hypothetical protein